MSKLTIPDEYTIHVDSGDESNLTFTQSGELILENVTRGSKGRALVPDAGDMLTINYAKEFAGGVNIEGQVAMPDLGNLAAGTGGTDFVHVDSSGKLYKGGAQLTLPPVPAGLETDYVRIDPLTGKLYMKD